MSRCAQTILLLAFAFALSGCVSPRPSSAPRAFDFASDTFSYANELNWDYRPDGKGHWIHQRHETPPSYSLHCFVVARASRQFFQHARFEPAHAPLDEQEYARLIDQVLSSSGTAQVEIPGYKNLREFSQAHEKILKNECGGSWHCYFQRGNWRMVLPFSNRHQEKSAQQLEGEVKQGRMPIAHLVRFPQLTINHAVLVYAVKKTDQGAEFFVYDPNNPKEPAQLIFDKKTREFTFPRNNYFPGGPVKVYEIYRSAFF